MPIESQHPLYARNVERWTRCRDAYEGEDAVKARGECYLPKLSGQTGSEYDAYKTRALFYEAVGRTIDGFVGAVSRKDPVLEVPAGLDPVVQDATADGLSLPEFVKQLAGESILQGRGGVLVDFDEKQGRPYFAFYAAETITNWDDGDIVLREVVYERDPDDKFQQVEIEQYRQLSLEDGVYTVTIWRRPSKGDTRGDQFVVYEETVPRQRGKALTEIPFFWLTPAGKTSRVEKPPLLGLVNVALSHYRTSADLEHGRHFSALPTLWVSGVSSEVEITVGAAAAIQLPDPQSKVGYAEFSGAGLGSLETALTDKEHMMAVLGAAVFSDGKKGVEAAETARIRTSGETSLLMGVVTAVEETIKAALECAAKWMGISGNVSVTLNRDFVSDRMDGPTLTALVAGYQAGALSLETFTYCLQQGEFLPPDTDLEQEVADLTAAAEKKAKDALAGQLAVKTAALASKPAE